MYFYQYDVINFRLCLSVATDDDTATLISVKRLFSIVKIKCETESTGGGGVMNHDCGFDVGLKFIFFIASFKSTPLSNANLPKANTIMPFESSDRRSKIMFLLNIKSCPDPARDNYATDRSNTDTICLQCRHNN
jgi:hypothetical protein